MLGRSHRCQIEDWKRDRGFELILRNENISAVSLGGQAGAQRAEGYAAHRRAHAAPFLFSYIPSLTRGPHAGRNVEKNNTPGTQARRFSPRASSSTRTKWCTSSGASPPSRCSSSPRTPRDRAPPRSWLSSPRSSSAPLAAPGAPPAFFFFYSFTQGSALSADKSPLFRRVVSPSHRGYYERVRVRVCFRTKHRLESLPRETYAHSSATFFL